MSSVIIVSAKHKEERPAICNLGDPTLIITNSYESPDTFELGTPMIDEMTPLDEEKAQETIILDHDETYHLSALAHVTGYARM